MRPLLPFSTASLYQFAHCWFWSLMVTKPIFIVKSAAAAAPVVSAINAAAAARREIRKMLSLIAFLQVLRSGDPLFGDTFTERLQEQHFRKCCVCRILGYLLCTTVRVL